jgi:hypothetical protein
MVEYKSLLEESEQCACGSMKQINVKCQGCSISIRELLMSLCV